MATAAPAPLKIATLITAMILVLVTEAAAWWLLPWWQGNAMILLGLTRLVQIAGILWILSRRHPGLVAVGLAPRCWGKGLSQGLLWSMAFGALAAAGMGAAHAAGLNPLAMLRSPMPRSGIDIFLFLLIGGLIGPVAEELCFRGILYPYFRDRSALSFSALNVPYARMLGIACALAASTFIFVALHGIQALPLTQIIGGLLFAAAFEITGSLLVPIVIHVSGNLAIFTIVLLLSG